MHEQVNKPIFVVGSPRSGTSILTWCLGHHPNLFPVPESNWMGDFAVNVAAIYQIGVARGDYSILSAMDIRGDELFAAFGQSINDLFLRHRADLERKRETSTVLRIDPRWLEAASTAAGAKTRWVDGTPEYSFHICGLRKLFPDALFIHLFRDVRAVIRSMLNLNVSSRWRSGSTALPGLRILDATTPRLTQQSWKKPASSPPKSKQLYNRARAHPLPPTSWRLRLSNRV